MSLDKLSLRTWVKAGNDETVKSSTQSSVAGFESALVRKYWWVLFLLSLIACGRVLNTPDSRCFLVPEATSSRKFVTNRHEDERNFDWNGSYASIPKRETFNGFGSPPEGYPWHRWESPSIKLQPLTTELRLIDTFATNKDLSNRHYEPNGTSLVDFKTSFNPLAYRTLVPYVIRNGVLLHSKRKEKMLKNKRWKNFQALLSDAMSLARRQQDTDPRIKALARTDFPLILSHNDKPLCNNKTGQEIPIFTWYTIKSCGYSWPVPDYHFCERKKNNQGDWDRQFSSWNHEYPWQSKLQKAVWRGTMTGPNVKDWRDLPRAKLVQLSINEQQRTIDAAFAEHPPNKRTERENEARNVSRVVPRMREQDYMNYRAIIDIDGNSWSSRYGYLLCFNSVIIKIESKDGYMAYYETELKPWKHYIPVQSNLTDLQSAVSFAVHDDNQAKIKAIISNAQSWCRSKLVKDQLAADLMWTLASYVELLKKGGDDWDGAWKENGQAFNLTAMDMQEVLSLAEPKHFNTKT